MPGRISCIVILLTGLSTSSVIGQGKLFFTGGVDLSGNNLGYKFQQRGYVLQNNLLLADGYTASGNGLNFTAGIHYRITPTWALEGGMQISEIDLIARDTRFQQYHTVAFDPPSSYNTLHAANGNFDFARFHSQL